MLNRNARIKPRNHLINCAEVARRLHISQGYVSSLLRGEKKNPKRMKQIFDLIIEEFRFANQCRVEAKFGTANGAKRRGEGGDK